MKRVLAFDDVRIVPGWFEGKSRSEVNPYVDFHGVEVLPIISSPMDCIYTYAFGKALIESKCLVTIHRFMSVERHVDEFQEYTAFEKQYVINAIGLPENDFQRFTSLYEAGARNFVIEVAHGAQRQVLDYFNLLSESFPECNVSVGNFAAKSQLDMFYSYCHPGFPDLIRLSIGGGSACETSVQTGCGLPTMASVLDCAGYTNLIADGGIRTPGDMCKALVGGAKFVMMGGAFAGCEETPFFHQQSDDTFQNSYLTPPTDSLPKHKLYRGSASLSSYAHQGKNTSYIASEGASWVVKETGSVKDVIKNFEGGLRSCMTYVGVSTIAELRYSDMVETSSAGILEGKAHGKK